MGNKNIELEKDISVKEKLNGNENQDGDVLDKTLDHVGALGLYQKLLFVAILPLGAAYAFVYFVQLFIAVTPQNYWCRIPELANLSMELRRNLSAPNAITGDWDHCMTFDTNWTQVLETLLPPPTGTPKVPCQHGWEFDFSDIPYETVASEREWVCDQAKNVPTAASLFFVGAVVSGILFGFMADRYGRLPTIIAANLIGGIGGIATTFTTGVWDFNLCRFLVGMSFDHCFMILYILILEYVGPQYRTLIANLIFALSFGVSSVVLPWMAYYIANWRILLWVTSAPMLLVIFAPWVIPESIRWLMSKGRINEAVAILNKFEKINGTKIPEHVIDEFIMSSNKSKEEEKQSTLTVFKSPPLRRTMLSLVLLYMGGAVMLDGLVRLSDTFGTDFFVTFTLIELSELLSILVVAVVLDKFGRRIVGVGPLFTTGVLLSIALVLPKGAPRAVLQIAARFFGNTSITCLLQWTTEILPTSFRASGCALLHTCAFLSIVVTPFIVYSERFWSELPLLIFTIITFLTAGIGLSLPETKGLPMPQTVTDSENHIRQHSLCGKRRCVTTSTLNDDKLSMKVILRKSEI